jgi:hypothetical protein
MARLLGDELQQDEAKIAAVEDALATATAETPLAEAFVTAEAATRPSMTAMKAAVSVAFATMRVFVSKQLSFFLLGLVGTVTRLVSDASRIYLCSTVSRYILERTPNAQIRRPRRGSWAETFRHPGEGRDPAVFLEMPRQSWSLRKSRSWIPAFAGMTAIP